MGFGFGSFRQTPCGRGFILLGFYTLFKCFIMLELFKALNGRLIGPKTWDRIIENFRNPNGQLVTVHGLFGFVMVKCVL